MSLGIQGEQVCRGKMSLNSPTCKSKLQGDQRQGFDLATGACLGPKPPYKLLCPSLPPVLAAFCGQKNKITTFNFRRAGCGCWELNCYKPHHLEPAVFFIDL